MGKEKEDVVKKPRTKKVEAEKEKGSVTKRKRTNATKGTKQETVKKKGTTTKKKTGVKKTTGDSATKTTDKTKKSTTSKGTTKATTKAKRGRPTLLNEKLKKDICKSLKEGAYMETTAALVGINRDTLYDWLRKGARALRKEDKGNKLSEEEENLADFSDRVKKAQAEGEVNLLKQMNKHAKTTWQAAAWRLERSNPQRYGRVRRITTEEQELLRLQIKKLEIELREDVSSENAVEKLLNLIEQGVSDTSPPLGHIEEGEDDENE